MKDILLMKKQSLKFVVLVLFVAFINLSYSAIGKKNIWANAQWIGYEELADSLKQVPAVHGNGNRLGEKCLKRSVVPLFRKTFSLEKEIKQASINICGLGHYELFINGKKMGNRFLAPGWSYYQKRQFYNTFDVTEGLIKGVNTIGAIVGNGFYYINRERYRKLVVAYGYPKLVFNLSVQYVDGTVANFVSDGNCTTAPSPITYSSIFGGEDYDARLEKENWFLSGYDDSEWKRAIVLKDTKENLFPEEDHPLKVKQEFSPVNIISSKSGKTIYDFGQNASGIISLSVKGNEGALVRIRPDELMNKDGTLDQKSGGGPYEFNYILKGKGTEHWQPKFTYYGFRYAEVEIVGPQGTQNSTEIVDLKMLHTRNSSPMVGSFSCSDTLFNQIFELILWGIKSNMASVTTDCPHREKLGWLEQTYLIGPSMHYNYDIQKLYTKIVTDMMDSQLDSGLVPDIAPEYVPFERGFRDSPEWGSAAVIIPWLIYKWYGDISVLNLSYPMMKKYVEYLNNKAENNILDYGLGDWYDLGPKPPGEAQLTPKAVTATSIYYYDLQIIKNVAKILGYAEDKIKFADLSAKVKKAFLLEFYDPTTGHCSTASQTAYAMPLYTGLIPEKDREKVLQNLVDILEKNDYALTAGDVGYHFLVRVLSENGRSDILYKMNSRSDRPGYGYQLEKGATALTESWAALSTSSNNHMMLGHLMEWFYAGLGGIYQAENSIAYSNIIIAPKPVGDIKWVNCSFVSPLGKISSNWKIENKSFSLSVKVPPKTSATINLPKECNSHEAQVVNVTTKLDVPIKISNQTFLLKTGLYNISVPIN